jgi:hypothetical protein
MNKFMKIIEQKYGQTFEGNYHKLYHWSVENIAQCWEEIWHFVGIRFSVPFREVVDDIHKMPGAKWFIGSRLNFAENLLKFRDKHLVHCDSLHFSMTFSTTTNKCSNEIFFSKYKVTFNWFVLKSMF